MSKSNFVYKKHLIYENLVLKYLYRHKEELEQDIAKWNEVFDVSMSVRGWFPEIMQRKDFIEEVLKPCKELGGEVIMPELDVDYRDMQMFLREAANF